MITKSEKILDISWGTILKFFVAIFCLYILYQIYDILILFIFSLIISILFTPIIDFLSKLKIPRVLAVIFVYLAFFGIISLLIYLTVPLFVSEIQNFYQLLPQYFDKASPFLEGLGIEAFKYFEDFISFFTRALDEMATTIFSTIFIIFGGIFTTIFLSLEEKGIEKTLSILFPKKYETYVLSLWEKCQNKVSGWFLSRILASLFVGLASFLVLLFFDVKYPLSFGLLAGFLNFVPYIGPTITGFIVFIIIGLTNIFQAIFILIILTLIQMIENNIVSPILTKKIIGLSPVLVLLSLVIGGTLWGFLGAILAIPLIAILFEFFKEFLQKRREEEEKEKAVIL